MGVIFLPGFFRFHDARRPKISKYSHRCCLPAWGIIGSRVISTRTPVMSTTTSVSVCGGNSVFTFRTGTDMKWTRLQHQKQSHKDEDSLVFTKLQTVSFCRHDHSSVTLFADDTLLYLCGHMTEINKSIKEMM